MPFAEDFTTKLELLDRFFQEYEELLKRLPHLKGHLSFDTYVQVSIAQEDIVQEQRSAPKKIRLKELARKTNMAKPR
ncbi:hypothetical protein [Hymenobacter fodinae]|uniref:Uncharacterized protein n=1 Tax=Hymenobacter fodinae TaxID=2510796 RepID=A0A4Z0NZ86_9BACT|nr:hypothetical protein [Hymenobacter fodinae]TGE03317.1 hypothetical protein EU556_25715 [Hymenobacter fodinae]